MTNIDQAIAQAQGRIKDARALLITAGAGMGVDSGLPDFRGQEGFWRAYPAIAKRGIRFEEMANPRWFARDPHMAWAFYGHRLHLYRDTTPHPGFARLLQVGTSLAKGYFVFTSNVDGQFQRAGFAASRIEECHGSIHHLQCSGPCGDAIWSADALTVTVDEEAFLAQDPLLRCPRCNAIARPNILMFGDWSWVGTRNRMQSEAFSRWLHDLLPGELVVVELGAGRAVPTVRMLSEEVALNYGATLVRINPRDEQIPPAIPRGISIPLGALAALSALFPS